MNSSTIDVGIDLGTSNSSVAVSNDGQVEVVRNNEDGHITPSVIRFLPNGSVQIGRAAYDYHRSNDDGSSFSRFKRDMGKLKSYLVSTTGASVRPEDLATELLKSLRADAETWVGHPISAAVITVPAMFELVQCDATQRAAARAGITQSPLLQEPIAAGLAYGFDRDLSDTYFIVYDLGGGTFDASLMQVSDGNLRVIDTAGDNHLGGRDWDRKLAGLLSQRLVSEGYRLWPADDISGREFRLRLELLAEAEKILLSRRDHVDVVLDGQLHDLTGRPIETTIPVAREELEQLIAPDIERSIDLLNSLLSRQQLPASAIAHIVLVGGPTRTPLLRRMVSSLTGISTETKIDPMTVVAEGAARFAAGVPREDRAPIVSMPTTVTQINLTYPSTTDDLVAHVGGRIDQSTDNALSIEIQRADGGWSSGRIPVQDGVFFTTVALLPRRPNKFQIRCVDEAGRAVPVSPDMFSIVQGLMVSAPPLARSVLIAAFDDSDKEIRSEFISRGTSLPAVARKNYRTVRTVNPGQHDDALNIHVLEGEFERPNLNRHVGYLSITGDRLERTLPAGTPVEITMRIDPSRRVTVSAYIPLLDTTFEKILEAAVLLEDDPQIVAHELDYELQRVRTLGASPQEVAHVNSIASEIQEDISAALAGDSDRASRADRRRKELANQIDQLEKRLEIPQLINELNEAIVSTQDTVNDHGDPQHRQRLTLLRTEAEAAINSGRADDLRRVRDEVHRLEWQILWELPAFWVNHFLYLSETLGTSTNAPQLSMILREGRSALDRQDIDSLRDVCRQLWEFLPNDQRSSDGLPNVGIRV